MQALRRLGLVAHGSETCLLLFRPQVAWKGNEVWMETELRHFCEIAVAKKKASRFKFWDRTGRGRSFSPDESRSAAHAEEATREGPLAFGVLANPLGSKPFQGGTVRFCNATKVCGRHEVRNTNRWVHAVWNFFTVPSHPYHRHQLIEGD